MNQSQSQLFAGLIEENPFLSRYRAPEGFFDELMDAEGRPRKRWEAFLDGVSKLGPATIEAREELLRRLIKENGVTYNVYGEADRKSRPWTMDIVPLILEAPEAVRMEEALGQRARLFNLILQDIYGAQRLLRGGLLPAMLVLGNPRFLRPCHGLLPHNHRHVHLYAADLARAPDGAWWVVNDRLDAPSGLGYAFENRILSARVLPELFHRYGVQRLEPFLRQLNESFERLAPKGRTEPNIVVLTPGPVNGTYFEQSYLARLLGYPLVEGADLTVRNHTVYLKTIAGMQQIDVIVRRIDSEWIDPLELRAESMLGVPGLLGALRHQRVAVVNTPGAGVLETPALTAFLPGICRSLLGEELRLPTVASWWCGQAKERAYVLEHLESLLIKPTFPGRGKREFNGPSLSGSELESLRHAIQSAPEYFCAQETVAQASAPVFAQGALEPRHSLFRAFLIPREGRFEMMPGGLARIASQSHSGSVSMDVGGESKDTWVTRARGASRSTEPVLRDAPVAKLRRDTENVPSRVGDNLFWLGRYVERAESLARVLRVVVTSIQEEYGTNFHLGVLPLMSSFLNAEQEARLFKSSGKALNLEIAERYIEHLIYDADCVGSLAENIQNIQRISRAVKARLSLDSWAILSGLGEDFTPSLADLRHSQEENIEELDMLLRAVAGFAGLVNENMTRGPGWSFLEVGRRVERGLNLCNLLYSSLVSENKHEESTFSKLLNCTDSSLTYRLRYLTAMQIRPLLDLLVRDSSNPRSLAFQVDRLQTHLANLPHHHRQTPDDPIDHTVMKLASAVGLFDLDAVLKVDAAGQRSTLADRLNDLADLFSTLSRVLSERYFSIIRVDSRVGGSDLL